MTTEVKARGAKGGGAKQHTPTEQPDSAQSLARCRMLLALGEGEFAGGLDDTRIFLDGTPIGNPDGTKNFDNVTWDFRPGTQAQTVIPGFPAVENETTIGVELKKATPWVRALTNTQIDAVLVRVGISSLMEQQDDGDIVGSSVTYHIDIATDGGAYQTIMTKTVTEKLSSLYEITHRINLPKANTSWQLRIVRDTADSTSAKVQNKTSIQAITEVIDARLRYPLTALLYVSFDAKAFSNIPRISCKVKGRVIQVPSNYDPVNRTYTGTWNGVFKWAWTNNPAWIWYDCLTQSRFGLGKRVKPSMLDKWELYRISQRCDQLVPDGNGGSGTEPRFKFDVYIQSQADAWQVIKDIASGFNGMTFWGSNMFNVISDMPADTSKLQIMTRASTVDKPSYSSGSEKTRFSSALVNFSDPDNHYQDRTTAAMFPDMVKQFGFKQTQITAIGCTRESEAQRRASWAVYSNSLDRIISLKTGLDGFTYVPGTVFAYADERVSGRVYGGRVTSYNAGIRAVGLDRSTSAAIGDTLMIRTAGGTVESRTIQAVNGSQLIVATAFSSAPLPDAVFVIDSGQLRLQYFRVTELVYNDEENTFTITAVEYNSSKYDAVDNNARLDTPPISLIPTGIVAQPTNITVSSYESIKQGQRVTTMLSTWDAPVGSDGKPQPDIIGYEMQWKRDDNEWINVPRTGLRSFEVAGIFEGDYLVRVRAINSGEASSLWASSAITHLKGRQGAVPKPVGLRTTPLLWGIQVDWAFGADTGDSAFTELQYDIDPAGSNMQLLTNVSYPTHTYQQLGLKAGQTFYYRARLVDKIGNKSDWTDIVRGDSNANADEYLDAIGEDLLTSDDGKALTEAVDFSLAGTLITSLAGNEGVNMQFKNLGQARAEISNLSTIIVNDQMAFAQYQELVAVQFGEFDASIYEVKTAQATADQAFAEYQTVVSASFNAVDTSIGKVQADVVTLQQAQVDASQAFAQYQQQVTTQFGQQQAAINQKMTSVVDATSASAIYSLRAGVNYNGQYYDAGLSIATIASGAGIVSRIALNADQFVMMTGQGGTAYSPFAVVGGQVFIRDAMIQDGTISDAKIGQFIQSSNYQINVSGWRLDKSGTFENYGSTAGEGAMKLTNQTISVRDGNGVLRVQVGRLTGAW